MGLIVLGAVALFVVLWFGSAPWRQARRRARWQRLPLSADWVRVLEARVPYVHFLPDDLRHKLHEHMQVFLRENRFVGCRGLVITDEMRVVVAAQACLLLLGRSAGNFPRTCQILLYPDAFVVERDRPNGMGLIDRERRVLTGESWAHGQVILSWPDVLHGAADPEDGRNVVIHEFAHQFDQEKGVANGAPYLRRRGTETRAARQARWAAVLQGEFNRLRWRAQTGMLGPQPLIDPYGATEPAEFFAVVSETFFERPLDLAAEHPALYAELADFYAIDPVNW